MFKVNVDKLLDMTETEEKSYQELIETLHTQYATQSHCLGVVGGGIKAFRLAAMMAKDQKVLFIDGDLDSEGFLGRYKLGKNLQGLGDYLENGTADMICYTNYENLNIVFTGTVPAEELSLESENRLDDLFADYGKQYDYIVVDSNREATAAKYCEGTLIMMDEGDYSELSSENLVKELEETGCKVLGIVINE